MNLATQAATAVTTPSPHVLTQVSLAYLDRSLNVYLRFGRPARTVLLDRRRSCAVFLPGQMFCRIRWEANDYGTTRWQLMVMQAGTPLDAMQRISGVRPGAQLLLRADGERQVHAVLSRIDAIEALRIDLADVAPAYWCTLGNRLAAGVPLPSYSIERHAASLSGRTLR